MEGLYNVRELYTIPEESSQVNVGEMEGQREDQREGWTKALFSKPSSLFTILSSLTAFLHSIGNKLWDFHIRGLKWLWHWVEVLVEDGLLAVKLMYVHRKIL